VAELSLEVVEGPDAGQRVSLGGAVEIGREAGVGLTLNDQLVSRRHARVIPSQGVVTVEDLGSRNGTFVNGNQLFGPTVATPGDQILVGVTVLQVRSAEQIRERPSAVHAVPPALATPPRQPDYLPPDMRPQDTGGAAQGAGPVAPPGPRGEVPIPELDPLLDVRTKRLALIAPVAIFVLVALVLMIFLATR
jgi:predicted component of type VI protein secretion system